MNTSFKYFAKEYWGLFIAVILFPTILFTVFFIIYQGQEIDKSIFAAFATCIISYVGTIGLSIFIFHDSWLRGKEEEYRNRPRVSINCHYDSYKLKNGDGHQCFFTYKRIKDEPNLKLNEIKIYDDNNGDMEETDYDYIGIILENRGSHLVYSNYCRKIYVVNRGEFYDKEETNIEEQKGRIWFSLKDNPSTLAFKDTAMHFLGIEKTLVDTKLPIRREIYILLSIEDDYSKEHHYILPIHYCNGTIMLGARKEIDDKQLINLYQNPRILLDLFDRKRIR
jgi:hypothetical protein